MDRRLWLPLLALVAAAAAAALYVPVFAGLMAQWYADPVSSHGILLLGVTGLLVRRRWAALRALPIDPRTSGFLLLAFGLAVYVIGSLTGDVFILRLSIPPTIVGSLIALCGTAHVRALAAPMVLVALAIPLPAVLIAHLTLPMQLLASRIAESALTLGGLDVVRAGNILTLRSITLDVAEACNGLRSLVSLIAVAAMCGALMSLPFARVAVLVAAAFPVAIVGNGLRIAATGFMATWFGPAAARGLIHELTGFVAFVAMCAALLLVNRLTRPRVPPPVAEAACSVHA